MAKPKIETCRYGGDWAVPINIRFCVWGSKVVAPDWVLEEAAISKDNCSECKCWEPKDAG